MKTTITLKQVAERAGCSVNAVSTVLNGARGKTGVSEALREKILLTADEMGYRPNLMARAMKAQRSHQVGVLVRNNSRLRHDEKMAHPLAYEFVLGISEGLEEAGYMMSFVRLSDVDPEKHIQSSAFRGHLLDGLIVVNDVPAAQPERLESLVPHIVWLDTNVWRENNCIRRDEFHAGELAVTKIADAGYRRMICLRRPHADNAHYSYKDRLAGVNASASQSGVSIEEFVLPWRPDEAAEVLPGFLRSLKNDVAVLALDIYMVQEIASWLLREGIRPGKDFPLACCDDGFHGSANWQMLSRVSFSRFEMGIQAAQIMIHGFENPENPFPSQQQRGQWQKGHTLPVLHNS